jgi:hypothetical protein
MSAMANRTVLGVALLALCSGCAASARPGWLWVPWLSEADPNPRQPNTAIRGGEPPVPSAPPARASREQTPDPAETLYRLGLLQADPTSGLRDYRAARATFTHLLTEYPRSRWEAEARAWQATLTDLLVREDAARRALLRLQRSEEESKRAKSNLEWLKQTDIDHELRK